MHHYLNHIPTCYFIVFIEGACYQQTKQLLHTGLPERVICRETEQDYVNSFLDSHIKKKLSGSLYISGAPGTGKTAVVSNMMKSLKVFLGIFSVVQVRKEIQLICSLF